MKVEIIVCLMAIAISESLVEPIQELRIGGLFQDDNEEIAFRLATNSVNSKYGNLPFRLVPHTARVQHYNAFNVWTNACHLLQMGVIGIFGPSSMYSSPFLQTVFDRKEIPHIETHSDPKLVRNNCLLNVHPHPAVLSQAYMDLVLAWKWPTLIVLYEAQESLSRISPLLSLYATYGHLVALKQLETDATGNYRPMLTSIKKTGETNFVVDCSIDILEEVLVQAQQVGMMTENYNYIITNLDAQTVDLAPFQFSGTNITALRLINPNDLNVITFAEAIERTRTLNGIEDNISGAIAGWKMQLKTALIVDAVELFYKAIMELTTSEQLIINTTPLFCNRTDNWKSGHTIINYMKGQSIEGLTGAVKFDTEGFRRDFTLEIIELAPGGLSTIGTWHPMHGLNISRWYLTEVANVEEGSLANKTFTVITCLTTPYGMYRQTTAQLSGNDRYEGFGIELIQELSQMLGFNYTIVIQKDGKNGNYNATTGQWNGLIGAIIRGEADLAIADLTVTAERESVVDFTLQFMNLGISILYKKPEPVPPSLFMFASPFSNEVWLLLGVAYLLVSLIFFVMGRLSPNEWTNPYPCVEEPEFLINQFSIRNSLWFTIGSLMQQGSEIAPVAISTRTAAGVWWFFTLIMVSSYTANLAAFLTVETLVTSFSNVEELAHQTEIKFGAQRGGATANFFKEYGNDPVRKLIWETMKANEAQVMTSSNDEGVKRVEKENYAYFMESTTIEYVVERHCSLSSVGAPLDDKGYAIAMKKNSPYRNDLSTAILKLQETGRITALKEKWWREKHGAGNCGGDDSENEATPLDLKNVGGVFLVLFIGTVIGFIGSCVELAMSIYNKTKPSNVPFNAELTNEMKFFVKFKKNVRSAAALNDTGSGNKLLQ